MAFEVKERLKSRRRTDTSAEFTYIVVATEGDVLNEEGARLATWSQMRTDLKIPEDQPLSYNGLVGADTEVEPVGYLGDGRRFLYYVTVRLGPWPTTIFDINTTQFEFDTTGGSTHIISGLQHIASFPAPGKKLPPNPDAHINISPDGESFGGVDIPEPRLAFNISWNMPGWLLTPEWVSMVYWATGRVNSEPWGAYVNNVCRLSFSPHEVLFLGVRGRYENGIFRSVWSFQAAASLRNVTESGVPNITKDGFDYMHPFYGPPDKWDPDGGPMWELWGFYVERVCREFDFNQFGLP